MSPNVNSVSVSSSTNVMLSGMSLASFALDPGCFANGDTTMVFWWLIVHV